MDSSNNINNTKVGKELDIRDIVSYLLSKICLNVLKQRAFCYFSVHIWYDILYHI